MITLDIIMRTDAERPRDEIIIEGTPHVEAIVVPAIQGGLATAAVLVNSIPAVLAAWPGLLTMLDLVALSSRRA